jgi:hypothetical protein
MDDQQALAIVSALANGANPVTGEMFAPDSPYQTPDVIRALFVAQRALEGLRESTRQKASTAPPAQPRNASNTNAGKPWSSEEDRQLLAAFDADKPITEIAREHGRTVGGVRARLEKHGRLEPSPATRWPSETRKSGASGAGQTHATRGQSPQP